MKPFNICYIAMLITQPRVESAYSAIKKYLGRKRTKESLLTTWLYLKATILTQISEIKVGESSKQDCTPLDLNQILFCSVSGVVIQYICQKVQEYYNKTIKLYKLCTRVFTRVTELPCAHVYNDRQDTTGFLPSDFHRHWFWD